VDETPPRSGRQNFRSIRGGSFGYYGISQRCCDREFNSPRYQGYIYIGFRVVKPL
jgi:formylglycine-generating enzyme required for sulfatase activity